jgi:hypothetical protein
MVEVAFFGGRLMMEACKDEGTPAEGRSHSLLPLPARMSGEEARRGPQGALGHNGRREPPLGPWLSGQA